MYKLLLSANLIIFASFSPIKAENNRTFPEGFLIGVTTGGAFQTEGAWKADGKGESIWDHWIHDDPTHIENNDTADVSADSYHHYLVDVADASDLGATHYHFSISWTRILPNGIDSFANMKGIAYYQSLLQAISYSDMIPVATLYYQDLPQPLQDLGGWENPEMVKYFVQYARVAFQYFPKIQYWITFNDPKATCRLGYGTGAYAPGIADDGNADYLCSSTVLKAHAAVYHMYQEEFPNLKAKMSMAIDIEWSEPATDSPANKEAAERRNLFEFGMYGHPIFIGNWPQVVIDRVGNRSEQEQLQISRLPEFTQEEIDYIKGTADFMAINTYSTRLVEDIEEPEHGDPSYMKDMKVKESLDPSWELAPNGNAIVPWGARKALNWLKTVYNDPEIFITENGVPDDAGYNDDIRIKFITEYLLAILDAMYEDKVKVFGYTVRSLNNEFEWTDGYSQHFGFFQVNFSGSSKMRSTRKSYRFCRELTNTLRVPDLVITTSTSTTISTITTQKTTPGGAANRITLYPSLILFIIYFCYSLLLLH